MDDPNIRFVPEEDMDLENMVSPPLGPILMTDGGKGKSGIQMHHHCQRPYGYNFVPTGKHQTSQQYPSQPNQVAQNQTDQQTPSQGSVQTTGKSKPKVTNAERCKEYRDKLKKKRETLEDDNKKGTENERILTEKVDRFAAERMTFVDKIGELNLEKMELKKEKKELITNMTVFTENDEKLLGRLEALSQSINSQKSDMQLEFQKIHQRLDTLQVNVMPSSKQSIENSEGFQHLNGQISKQNRLLNITREVVLQLDVHGDKDKQKVMEVVAGLSGIDSILIEMEHKKLTVIGGVDPIDVVIKLREKWDTKILTVLPVKEEKKGGAKKDEGRGSKKSEDDKTEVTVEIA